jgi:6-phosphogluconate dehydrogenase
LTEPTGKSRIGVTGLAVMGANLACNIARRGTPTAVHNRTTAKMTEFNRPGFDLFEPVLVAEIGSIAQFSGVA